MSLWSPCGLYANLPYGYAASTNYVNPTYNGISTDYNNLPYEDATANLNDLSFDNTSKNYTGIPETPSRLADLPYSLTNQPTFNLTTESPDNRSISAIGNNLSVKNVIKANNSLSKRWKSDADNHQ